MLLSTLMLLAASQATPAAAPAQADRIVCRVERESQSRIAQRICRRQSFWDEMARSNAEDLRRAKRGRF